MSSLQVPVLALLLAIAPPVKQPANSAKVNPPQVMDKARAPRPMDQRAPFHTQAALHTLRIELSEAVWNKLQPKPKGFMQNDFPEERAAVIIDDKPYIVSIRFKGNGTYMMSGSLIKRPFKIDIDKIVKGQSVTGVTTLNLGNNVMDQTGLREALAYELFTRLGVPCSQTTFADVTLHIPGYLENQPLGLYSVPEQLDTRFFARHYTKPVTFVLKPENAIGLPKFDTWKQYELMYDPKGKPTTDDKNRFMEFITVLHDSTDDVFAEKLGDYLDLENFACFLAGTVVTSSMDSILAMGHNYYIIRNPDSGKFQFLPWDLDLAFGAFPMAGANGIRLAVDKPFTERELLIKRYLAVPIARKRYETACRDAVKIMQRLEPLRAKLSHVVAPSIAKNDLSSVPGAPSMGMFGMPPAVASDGFKPSITTNKKSVFVLRNGVLHQFDAVGLKRIATTKLPPIALQAPMPDMFSDGVTLTQFFNQRSAHVLDQLAGKVTGEQPRGMGEPGGLGGDFDLGNLVGMNAAGLLGSDKASFTATEWISAWANLFSQADSDNDRLVSRVEWESKTNKPNDFFANIFPGQLWKVFGESTFTQASFTRISTAWFDKFDNNHDGNLTRKEVGNGFLSALPPPDFGQGGAFPPRQGK